MPIPLEHKRHAFVRMAGHVCAVCQKSEAEHNEEQGIVDALIRVNSELQGAGKPALTDAQVALVLDPARYDEATDMLDQLEADRLIYSATRGHIVALLTDRELKQQP